jgi:hypothetical protein
MHCVACVYTLIYYPALFVRLANMYISLTHELYTRHRSLSVVTVTIMINYLWLTVHCEILPVACVYTLINYCALYVRLANTYISLTHERYSRHRPLSVVTDTILIICLWLTVHCEILSVACVYTLINYSALCVYSANMSISLTRERYTKHRPLSLVTVTILITL